MDHRVWVVLTLGSKCHFKIGGASMKIIMIDDDLEGALALRQLLEKKDPICDIVVYDNHIDIERVIKDNVPDLVLMDIQMPDINGIDLCQRIKSLDPNVKVLMFTSFKIKQNIRASINAGCDGLIYKQHASDELVQIIKLVTRGMFVFDENLASILKDGVNEESNDAFGNEEKMKLTERELSIVQFITLGKTNAEISKELYLSEGYIRNQLVEIRNKLNLRNSKELAAWGAKIGL